MATCPYCFRELDGDTGRSCQRCSTSLHETCWDQIAERELSGCGHHRSIAGAAFVDQGTVVSVQHGGRLHLWQVDSGIDREVTLSDDFDTVHRLSDSSRFAAVGTNTICVVRLADGEVETRHDDLDFSITYSALARSAPRMAMTSGAELRLYDLATDTLRPVGEPLDDSFADVAISPDGSRVAGLLVGGRLVVRDADLGMDIAVQDLSELSDYFNVFEFSATGAELLLYYYDELVALDSMSGQQLWKQTLERSPTALRATDDGRIILVGSGQCEEVVIRVLDRSRGHQPLSEPERYRGHIVSMSGASFLDDQQLVTWSEDRSLLVIDRGAHRIRRHLRGHRAAFWTCPDLRARHLWSLDRRAGQAEAVSVGDDSIWLEAGGSYPAVIERRDLHTGDPRDRLTLDGLNPARLAEVTVAGERRLVYASSEGLCLVDWDGRRSVWRSKSESKDRRRPVLLGSGGADEPLLVASASWDGFIEGVAGRSGEVCWSHSFDDLYSTALGRTHDGRVLWVTRSQDYGDRRLVLQQVAASGELAELAALRTDESWSPELAAITPDGAHVVFATLYLPDHRGFGAGAFDVDTGRIVVRSAVGHPHAIYGLAVSPVGHLLATCSADRSVRLWDLRSGEPVFTWSGFAQAAVRQLYFSPDGGTLVSVTEQRQLDVWDLGGIDPRTDAFATLCQAARGGEEARRSAATQLGRPHPTRPLETIAGVLAAAETYPDARAAATEGLASIDRHDAGLAALAEDFDRRVRAGWRRLS